MYYRLSLAQQKHFVFPGAEMVVIAW